MNSRALLAWFICCASIPSLVEAQEVANDAQGSVAADEQSTDEAAVLAVVDSALAYISAEDMAGYTDLVLEEGLAFTVYERQGELGYRVQTRAEERASSPDGDWIERGFEPVVQVSGHLATVWLPYDFYVDGEWSHCGVDALVLLRTAVGWRIASFAWTVQQPPECRPHPDGPPES